MVIIDDNEIRLEPGKGDVQELVELAENLFRKHRPQYKVEVEERFSGRIVVSQKAHAIKVTPDDGAGIVIWHSPMASGITEDLREGAKAIESGDHGVDPKPEVEQEDYNGSTDDDVAEAFEDFEDDGVMPSEGPDIDSDEVEIYNDGSVRFMPKFTKEEADYRGPHTSTEPETCRNCAFYIDGGACHVVRGGVDPRSHCENFYADVVVAGNSVDKEVILPLIIWGEGFNWDVVEMARFIEAIEEKMEREVS